MGEDSQEKWPRIPERGTSLGNWQTYVGDLVKARGWDKTSELETYLLFSEEVGELAKAFRRHRNLFSEPGKQHQHEDSKEEIALELADILSYLFDMAQRLDIDLEAAAIRKEELNRKRHWD